MWSIYRGHLPFRNWAEDPPEIEDGPTSVWRQKRGELPYKLPKWSNDPPEVEEYPVAVWRQTKGKLPYKKWPKPYVTVPPVRQKEYITAYDMHTLQEGFKTNGDCILRPLSAEITEELNGVYELTLTHPVDAEGKWRHLLEWNIIKAGGQLFRIYNKSTTISLGNRLRTVRARHIFYDLNAKMVLDADIKKKDGYDFIKSIFENIMDDDPGHNYLFYNFSYDSDITDTADAVYKNITPVAALMGEDNSLINRLKGELYRDNFYFSVNRKKEKAVTHEQKIRYGIEMIEISEEVDYSDFVTNVRFYDNHGNGWGVSYTPTTRFVHNVTRVFHVTYPEPNYEQLVKDGQDYFGTVWRPKVTYTVRFANLRDTELYRDYIQMKDWNVGDTVTIYSEELDIDTEQKVMRKVTDALTGETIEIVLGNLKGSLTRKDKMGSTITGSSTSATQKALESVQEELKKTSLKMLTNWKQAELFTWDELRKFSWKEVKNG